MALSSMPRLEELHLDTFAFSENFGIRLALTLSSAAPVLRCGHLE